jgi:hypothetical protein
MFLFDFRVFCLKKNNHGFARDSEYVILGETKKNATCR